MQLCSSSYAKCETPETEEWTSAPPRPFWLIFSPVTAWTTSGPVMNICEVSRTMKMKSVSAGEYAAPPAHGPSITLICGMTPEARVLRWKMPP